MAEEQEVVQSEFEPDVVDEFVDGEYDATSGGLYQVWDGEETESKGEEEDVFSHLGDSSDDPEQKRLFVEYLDLIKQIEAQNHLIEDMKANIIAMCAKECKTRCEIREIKRLRECMETENLKLLSMMDKAVKLQNFGSKRHYLEIPIATTIDEENMSPYIGTIPPQATNYFGDKDQGQGSPSIKSDKSTCEESHDENKQLMKLCKVLCKMKPRCPEDKKALQEIAAALMCSRRKDPNHFKPCGHKKKPCKTDSKHDHPCPSGGGGSSNLDKLKKKVSCMQQTVDKLKKELCSRERDRIKGSEMPCRQQTAQSQVCNEEADPLQECLAKRKTQKDHYENLKENYLHLLSEFAKKDCQMQEMEKRLKSVCGSCGGSGGGNKDQKDACQAELQVLRVRVAEMKEEQVEFKCLMREQANQLEDYRNKYMTAQQKVEEQTVTLDKLNLTNKRIERQINEEVKEIRAKFQEKINELTHFPKLLENEQIKLAQCCKEKDELQGKLVLVCKELKAIKLQQEQPKGNDNADCQAQLIKAQYDLSQNQKLLEDMQRQRDLFCEQLKTTQEDLDMLRSESAKIIARTKERTQTIRAQMQEQIDRLEKELAQCRATACLSVSDREAVIREMQGQLNTLSYSFDAAQKQIKTLRNHIAYVSNENCFPVKC